MAKKHQQPPFYNLEDNNDRKSFIPVIIGAMIVGVISVVIWYFFFSSSLVEYDREVPLIKAEDGPTKIHPETSSQPEVPHQDKLIYTKINPAERTRRKETILPEGEEPIDIKSIAPFKNQKISPQNNSVSVAPDDKKNASCNVNSVYRIQFASVQSASIAQQYWQQLKNDYPQILGPFAPHFTKVDLGINKGFVYKIQVGDFQEKEDANKICKNMKNKNPQAGCFIITYLR